jgi:LacI family transcriptional regulator
VIEGENTKVFSYDLAFLEPDKKAIEETIKNHLDADGIFCESDVIAMLVIQALKKLGKSVPNDVQVIGFDNIQLACMMEPNITTIEQSSEKIGKTAIEMIMNLISGNTLESFNKIIDVKLIERETTKKSL